MDASEARRTARSPAVWAGLLVPPLAWAAQLVLSDLLFELGCGPGVRGSAVFGLSLRTVALMVSGLAVLATLAVGLATVREWRRLRDLPEEVTAAGRARDMAWWAVLSVGFYLVIIVFGIFPPLALAECAPLL